MHSKEYTLEIGGKEITVICNDLANQANGSVMLKCDGTVVMATAVISKSDRNNPGFFNLTVEYLEKFYAAGKILGGQFNHREGKPSDQAVLASRMIDRTIRPLFEHHIKNAVQVVLTVIAVGGADPKTLAINAASIALSISDIPWGGPVSAVHISKTKENSIIQMNNYIPATDELTYTLDLLVCGKEHTINMIESMACELGEDEMGLCFDTALLEIAKWETFQLQLRSEIGKEKLQFPKQIMPAEAKTLFEARIAPMLSEKLFSIESKKVAEEAESMWKNILTETYIDQEETITASEDYLHEYMDREFHLMALGK